MVLIWLLLMMKNGDSLATTLIKWLVLPSNSINYYWKGKSQKTRFFCKYVLDTEIKFYDDQNTCDLDVAEFLSTIMYLVEKSTFNFLHGPMLLVKEGCLKVIGTSAKSI